MTEVETILAVTREQMGKCPPEPVPTWKTRLAWAIIGVFCAFFACVFTAELGYVLYHMFTDSKVFLIVTCSILGALAIVGVGLWAISIVDTPLPDGEVGR